VETKQKKKIKKKKKKNVKKYCKIILYLKNYLCYNKKLIRR